MGGTLGRQSGGEEGTVRGQRNRTEVESDHVISSIFKQVFVPPSARMPSI